MNSPPANAYDFPQFLKDLQNKSRDEIETTVAAKYQELEPLSFGVKGAAECRDVGILKFKFKLKELQEFLSYHHPPACISRAETQIYRPVFDALVARGEWPGGSMYVFTERRGSYGSFFEFELDRQTEEEAAHSTSESPEAPPPLPVSASPSEPPPLPIQRNPKEPPPLPGSESY